jgi:diguanylate cyclase (GGDEF)-like protein
VNPEPFLEAARELRGRFFSLIDSLSALRGLTSIEIHHRPEADLLRGALDVLLRHQDMERCSVFLVDDGQLTCSAGRDWDDLFSVASQEPAHESAAFAIGEGLMGEAARSGEMVHCASCADDPRFEPLTGRAAPTGSLICAPIISRDEVLGVVNVYHPRSNHFESWHEHTLALFCRVLGHMLENNRLLRQMENAVEERTRQLEAALREAEQLKRRYEQLSNVDELTALHNRRFFFPEAESSLARSTRYGHPFSLMLIDVDRFKQINDRHGHATGDNVLKAIGAALKAQIREVDIIARFGGEEFVIALPSTDAEGSRMLAERIRTRVAALEWDGETGKLSATISVGVASLGARAGEARELLEALLREADRAMYQAKEAGRNRVSTYFDLPPENRTDVGSIVD